MFFYYIAEANEALIITGAGAHSGAHSDVGGPEGAGFKIVVGKGAWALTFFQKVRRLGLQAHTTLIQDDCVTQQGIPVRVRGVVVFKVGDDFASIANAARRFLENEEDMDEKVHNVFAGHLRSIVGNMTVESIISGRDELAGTVRTTTATEMQKLGLVIDSFQIQEVDDPTGYIENLAAPHKAAVEAAARIAKAERDQEATQREQEAEALMAQARSQSQVKQAELTAAAEAAQQKAAQAGPLAEAVARMAVVEQETRVSELEATRRERQLQVEVVKPAEAARDARVAEAEAEQRAAILEAEGAAKATELRAAADATATRLNGEADGAATKARLVAEADGIDARARALAENPDAVIGQQIAEQMPQIVEKAAAAFGNIGSLTVLNGAEGMGDMMRQVVGLGVSILPIVRQAIESGSGNGSVTRESTNATVEDS